MSYNSRSLNLKMFIIKNPEDKYWYVFWRGLGRRDLKFRVSLQIEGAADFVNGLHASGGTGGEKYPSSS